MRTLMMTLRRLFGGLGSLAAILTLLFGVPLFLWRVVGWPLPTALPSWHQFSSSITQTELPTAALAKTLACFGWLAWLVVAAALTVELAAWFAGRSAPQLRFARPFQPLANKLVTTAALLFAFSSISSGIGASASIPLLPRLAVATASLSSAPAAPISVGTTTASKLVRSDINSPAASAAVSAAVRQQTVRGRDTLWDLAERHLGDPHRWVEIWELNKGHLQNDGRAFESAHWIYPGWVLRMPADAVGVEEVEVPAASLEVPSAGPSQPQPSEASPSTILEPSTTTVPAPSSTVPPPTSVPVASTTATIPSTTERIVEPTARSDEPAETAVPPQSARPHADEAVRFPLRVPWVAGGLSAVGLLFLLDRLRRRQRSSRKPGDPIHLVPEGLAPVETGLRRSSARAAERCDLLDAALRAFAAGAFGDPAMHAPQLLAARSFADSVELLLDRPLDGKVLGFTSLSGGRLWVTEPAITTEILRKLADDDSIAPYPTLVTMGEVDGGDLLVDLESAGILTVHQRSIGTAGDVFRRIVVEIATSQWGDFFDVITIGDEVLDFAGFERTRRLSTLDDALDALEASAREIDESLNTIRATSTVAPRTSFALGDGWTPSVLVTTTELDTRQIMRLQAIVGRGGRGTAALLLDEVAIGQWGLRCGPDNALLSPLDIEVTPHSLPIAYAEAVAELLDDAAVGHVSMSDLVVSSEEPFVPVVLDTTEPRPTSESPAEECELVLPSVEKAPTETDLRPMVRVLGAVGVDNMDHQGRRKVVELVVYLALHPDGVSADRLSEALWPDQPPKPDTLIRNVAYARTALGRDSNGDHHLPRMKAAEGRYRLGPEVRCDLLELTRLSKDARESSDVDEQILLLTEALALVRDKPFDSVTDYEWAWAENFVAVAEAEVADSAQSLVALLTEAGRHGEASRVRLAGLRGAPDCPQLAPSVSAYAEGGQ